MRPLFRAALVLTLAAPWPLAGAAQQAPRLGTDENTWIQFGVLGQVQAELAEDAAGVAADKWALDLFTRRFRVMGRGSVHSKVKFFFSTDVPNTGRAGGANTLIWNDGFVDFQLGRGFNIAFGRFLMPFSPEVRASAGSLLGIDYNLNVIKTPTTLDRASWRDDGIEARGVLMGGRLEYRGGIFHGAPTTAPGNPDHAPRLTGLAMVNFGAAQPGWFYNPNSLGTLTLLSVGAGYDRIPNSAAAIADSRAWNVFALADQPFGGGRLNAQVTYYDWQGPAWAGGFEGTTLGAQFGWLLPGETTEGRWQPVLRLQRQDPDGGTDLTTVNLGLNYYVRGHYINLKVDYAINDRLVGGERVDALRFQTQLMF